MNDNFNDFEEKKVNGESGQISGFDSAVSKEDEKPQNYGTQEDGFYTKNHNDIIQDSPVDSSVSPEYSGEQNYQSKGNVGAQNNYTAYSGTYGYNNTYNNNPNGYYNGQQYTTPIKKSKKRYGVATVIIASILAAIIGAGSSIAAMFYLNQYLPFNSGNSNATIQSPANVNINVDRTVESVAEAVSEKVSPSVVGIRTTTSVMNFFGGRSEATGEGSGVIYTSDGYIITNYHVIKSVIESSSNAKIEVFLNGDIEKSYDAEVIGYHISSDLAIIKIKANGLPAITIADSDNLKKGQYVVAIGNPGGLEFMDSITVGVISGLNRVVSSSSGISLIQTDAAINPGNSGGALVNINGELIGINSSKIVAEEFEGMGFAIPSNTVVEKCKRIIERKDTAEPYIGITVSERYTADVLNYYGFPAGAVVLSVDEGSPADNIGIRKGDIITKFDSKDITEYNLLSEYLHDCEPNSKVEIEIYRSGKYYKSDLTIGSNGASR